MLFQRRVVRTNFDIYVFIEYTLEKTEGVSQDWIIQRKYEISI